MVDADLTRRFVPGLELAGRFYTDAVRPLLDDAFPSLEHSAALLGDGSEVLGLDSERSTDHDWGPRLLLFLSDEDHARFADRVAEVLAWRLPLEFEGYPTGFGSPDPTGTRLLHPSTAPPIDHRVELHTVGGYLRGRLGFDPREGVGLSDWLGTPSQLLLSVSAGAVFHDGLGQLGPVRAALDWYPHDVWLYLLAVQWQRIDQEEPFVGRTAEAGDELGSRIVAARLVRDVMRLCFLIERRYAPYAKWLGTAFLRLDCGPSLAPRLEAALAAANVGERERSLSSVYEEVASRFNALGITDPEEPTVRGFHDRPYQVLGAGRFAAAALRALTHPAVRALTAGIGAVDQFVDSTDVLSNARLTRAVTSGIHRGAID